MIQPIFFPTTKGIINAQYISLIEEERMENDCICLVHLGFSGRKIRLTGQEAKNFLKLVNEYIVLSTVSLGGKQ